MSRLGSPLRLLYWCLLLFSTVGISDPASAQMAVSVRSANFGTVQVGSSMISPVAVTNAGKSSVTISQASTSSNGFSLVGPNLPITLSPHRTVNLSVSFAPQASGSMNGTLTVVYAAAWGGHNTTHSGTVSGSLSGTGSGGSGYLTAPATLNFGSIAVGSSQTQSLTVSNTGGASVTISAATVTGSGFTVSGLSLPYTLAAGASANLSLTFSPPSSGSDTGTLNITSDATDSSVTVSLTGSGTTTTGTLGVTPGSMSFGSITIGSNQSQSGNVTASGGSVTLTSASSNNSAFTLTGLSLPVTLNAGQSVPFTLTFAPTAAGSASATISFFTNSNSASETATGSGATIQHIVDLSWNASTSTAVTGYNVYRASSPTGSYTRINSGLNASTNFSDSTVQSGGTYYYATTAVDSSGAESTYSNQAQVAIPFP